MVRAAATLEQALRDGRVFVAGRIAASPRAGLPSGMSALDAVLPWGGFPRGALTELLVEADGLGELSLLLPALAELTARERVALVAPPYIPCAPAWVRAGVTLEHLAWIDIPPARAPWTAEQCLRAGCLGAVLTWSDARDERLLRRLQVAAGDGDGFAFLFRPARHADDASPAALRLRIEAGADGATRLRVLKCRGATPPAAALPLPRAS
ncbi:MAG: translesion DNA synthesis-associated protein ImuA [Proteobacteria bacterium]|nr:translesion DNA synthesis-associated protein ImuA [Pseudomonadota bacterium]